MPVDKVLELQEHVEGLELPPGRYHIPLRNKKTKQLYGYAAIKTVGSKHKPVLATFYTRRMGKPKGTTLPAV